MDVIFMNSENCKTFKSTNKFTNKLDLRIGGNSIALSNLSI